MSNPLEFKSKAAVHRWLDENGWEISRSHFYDHCRDGLIRKKKGGKVYTMAAVEKYAKLHCKQAETGEKTKDRQDRMQEELREIELATAKAKLAEKEHALEVRMGRVISREDHEAAIVGRVVSFRSQLAHMVLKSVPDWIAMAGGDQATAPALMEAMQVEIDRRLSAFAADTEFEVLLEADR